MLSAYVKPVTRRHCLAVGSLGLLGINALDLARLRATAANRSASERRKSNSCVFIFLFGGPSHIDLWDMKPDAPLQIRGEFHPTKTRVPGMHLCEHLPLLGRQTDKLCLLRSMTHRMPVHGPACSEIYSGRPYFGPPVTDQARGEDWPSIAAMTARFGPQDRGVPASVVLPWYSQFVGQDRRIAGQTGGRMGERFNPFLVVGDPSQPDFRVEGLPLPADVNADRLSARRELLGKLEVGADSRGQVVQYRRHQDTAYRIVGDSGIARALNISQEPPRARDAYGPTKFGQSLLLARRLVEAGVPLTTVNWDDDTRNDKVSPHWDTHYHNFRILRERILPVFDRSLAAFLEDLDARGLLERTLVVVSGEFGRTPKIGQFTQNNMTEKTGRDHWPYAFTVLLAGGGVRGGQVYGETDRNAGYVKDRPVSPADLAATIFQHLGIDSSQHYWDEFMQTRQVLSEGTAIRDL